MCFHNTLAFAFATICFWTVRNKTANFPYWCDDGDDAAAADDDNVDDDDVNDDTNADDEDDDDEDVDAGVWCVSRKVPLWIGHCAQADTKAIVLIWWPGPPFTMQFHPPTMMITPYIQCPTLQPPYNDDHPPTMPCHKTMVDHADEGIFWNSVEVWQKMLKNDCLDTGIPISHPVGISRPPSASSSPRPTIERVVQPIVQWVADGGKSTQWEWQLGKSTQIYSYQKKIQIQLPGAWWILLIGHHKLVLRRWLIV